MLQKISPFAAFFRKLWQICGGGGNFTSRVLWKELVEVVGSVKEQAGPPIIIVGWQKSVGKPFFIIITCHYIERMN